MATTGKRKASVDSKGFFKNDRPILKRRGTSVQGVSGFRNLNIDGIHQQQEQHQYEARTDSAMSTYNYPDATSSRQDEAVLSTPPVSATLAQDESMNDDDTTPPPYQIFQSRLTAFCQKHGHAFGPSYLSDLQRSHQQATETSVPSVVLSAGQFFIETLNRYVGDLQAAALQQVQLRTVMAKTGVDKAALEAVDVVLTKLDDQITVMEAEAQSLGIELDGLERQLAGG